MGKDLTSIFDSNEEEIVTDLFFTPIVKLS
ncbi:Uncharacterised protein [Enterococcus malodoratus]|uniref:Uncharacterized protein n=1 Tax=Enterococcus malodoratus ATCC 43197 TaxID=1158601 RepID=R2QMI9_9ENTE|nr:hypothetical protein UAI_03729 [Enterococcus malodoratus ATCC 43197]EOT67393.1 hypothetical protein I585_02914 [Enterococcus malodoratus ATCC 43197]SPX03149.1 Uncharacterised protein [Enterococcus malodoratus]STD69355.1 Uncharacterised protein [Enterococcus malodoratus]